MKTQKYFSITAIFFAVIILFNTCDSSNTYTNLCWCEIKNHLEAGETCKCGADKGACECTEWVAYLESIPIHKKGVSWSGDTDSAVDNIFRAYTLLEPDERTVIKNKVTEIHITPSNNWGESIIALFVVPEGIVLEINGRSSRDSDIYMAFKYWVLPY